MLGEGDDNNDSDDDYGGGFDNDDDGVYETVAAHGAATDIGAAFGGMDGEGFGSSGGANTSMSLDGLFGSSGVNTSMSFEDLCKKHIVRGWGTASDTQTWTHPKHTRLHAYNVDVGDSTRAISSRMVWCGITTPICCYDSGGLHSRR